MLARDPRQRHDRPHREPPAKCHLPCAPARHDVRSYSLDEQSVRYSTDGSEQAELLGHNRYRLVMRRSTAGTALERDPRLRHRRVLRIQLEPDVLPAVPAADDPHRACTGERVEHDSDVFAIPTPGPPVDQSFPSSRIASAS
jgi:hypothetical protein